MTVTEHMLRARQAKARKLAAVVVEVAKGTGQLPSELARHADAGFREEIRRIAELVAGAPVHKPSAEAWNEVVEQLESAEAMANAFAGLAS